MKSTPINCISMLALVCVVLIGQPAFAHHSFATHFDPSKTMEINGVITEFSYRSPHSFVFVDAENADGETINWEVELHSRPTLTRRGLKPELMEPGEPIKIIAWPNRTPNNPLVFGIGIITSDGTRIGEATPIDTAESEFTSAEGVARVQGRWQVDFKPPRGELKLPVNTAGQNAVDNYEPKESPANTCEVINIPSIFHIPYLYDIRINDTEVAIRYEVFNIERIVPLGNEFQQTEQTGMLGSARARIEDGVLIIESKDYPVSGWGLAQAGDINGMGTDVPSSNQKTMIEYYSVSDDGLTLNINYELSDPVYLSQTYISAAAGKRVSDNEPIYEFNCELDSAARFSQDPE